MGFNPSAVTGLNNVKVRAQQAFRKPTERQYEQQEMVSPRLVHQYQIVPNDVANNGYILGVLDWFGEERHVKITMSEEAYQAQKARDAESKEKYEGNFNGAYINSDMEAKLKFVASNATDKKFVLGLEHAIFKANKPEKIGGIEFIPVVVRRIINFKQASKGLEGIFTASGYYDKDKGAYRVGTVDQWSINPIRIDDEENIQKIEEILDTLNRNRDRYDNGDKTADMLPNLGIKFIASEVTKTTDEKTQEEIVLSRRIFDTSTCMDIIQLDSGAYKPLNREFLRAMIEGFKEYVMVGDESSSKKNNVDPDKVLIEMALFRPYRTSNMDKGLFTLNTENENVKRRPLYQMIQTPYLNSIDDDVPSVGRNLAFTGFIKIGKNKTDDETEKLIVQSIVTSVNFGNVSGNVLSFLRNGEDGKKYEIDERIKKRYYTEEEKLEISKRREEKLLREGKSPSESLSKDSSLSASAGLSLQSAQSVDSHSVELDSDTLFDNKDTVKAEAKSFEPSSIEEDDDIPF